MYTQCPHCLTLFRIHARELKAAHGQARCCRCNGVFDALDNLQEVTATLVGRKPSEGIPATSEQQDREPQSADPMPLPFAMPDDLPDIPASVIDDVNLTAESQQRGTRAWAWALGTLLLTGLLSVQVAWIERTSLVAYPQGRYVLESVCNVLNCEVPTHKSPGQIRILSREVSAHSDIDNALLVNLVIANDAPFSQPYPVLNMGLFSSGERLIAQRHFSPGEYLGTDVPPATLLEPGQTASIHLELLDPGQSVTGYRFDFL